MSATAQQVSGQPPQYWQAFKEISKIRLIVGVAFTGFVGSVMARRSLPELEVFLYTMAALVLSGVAVSIQNNLLDASYDTKMNRTQSRLQALETFGITRLWILSCLALVIALAIAFFKLSVLAGVLLLTAILTYVLWYTLLLKRNNPFGAVLGGIPGAIPILIGSYAVTDRYAMDVWLLFLFMMLWQPPHFWALSLHLKDDYQQAGIPVLPVVFGNSYTKVFIYLYGLSLLPVTLAITWFAKYGTIYTSAAIALGIYYLFRTWQTVIKSERYREGFLVSLVYMFGLMLAILGDILIPV